MIKHYLKIAIRSFNRQKLYSLINVLGFSIGIACTLFILLYVHDEVSYDSCFAETDKLARVIVHLDRPGQELDYAVTPGGLAPALQEKYPEVEFATRYKLIGYGMFIQDDLRTKEYGMALADSLFFDVLPYKFYAGNPKTCLKPADAIVLTRPIAEKLFGTTQAVGKSIEMHKYGLRTVTAVIEEEAHTHLPFKFLLPFGTIRQVYGNDPDDMDTFDYTTYVRLGSALSFADLNEKVKTFFDAYDEANERELFLQPFSDVYLKSTYSYDFHNHGSIQQVWIFSGAAFVLLLIAVINFINLTTAQATRRTKEISLRKIHGATRRKLIAQFFGESMTLTIVGFLIGLLWVELFLPVFNSLAGKGMTSAVILQPSVLLIIIGVALVAGVAAGGYPALYLSSIRPLSILRGSRSGKNKADYIRQLLVILQFGISLVLIVATLVINRQLSFVQQKSLGYDQHQLIYLRATGQMQKHYQGVKQQLEASESITSVSATQILPIYEGWSTDVTQWTGNKDQETLNMSVVQVAPGYVHTLKIELIDGRDFRDVLQVDSANCFLINETARERMHMENPIGNSITVFGKRGTIIGVVKDYHFNSLHAPIEPLTIILNQSAMRSLLVRVKSNQIPEAIDLMESVWKRTEPSYPFNYSFLDQRLERLYRKEQKSSTLFTVFAVIGIVLSCMGLLGLSLFYLRNTQKVVGIKKVLGASVASLFAQLTLRFLRWIFIASIIAFPVAWYFMSQWLNNFAYCISMPWMVFLLALFLVVVLAVVTISVQVYKVARLNPVNTLRDE